MKTFPSTSTPPPRKIAFKTFGCRANNLDTDALYLEARRRGFEVVEETEVADAYIINSCTVTSAADRDARASAWKYKRLNPAALVGIVGCYAQVAREEILSLPEIDFCVGTANKFRILDHFNQSWQRVEIARDQVETPRGFLPTDFPGSRNSRASIKIQDGCNFHCSFCIIPDARGRSRSLPLDAVLKQVDEAYAQGFQEVVLTGIHLAHYGWDQGTDLMKLLYRIFERATGPRVRLSTLDPFEIPDELIALVGKEKRLCPHFHIAIQSGSNKILTGMRRIYKAREFYDVSAKIEKQCSDTFIGMDVIVGFPGEGEAEFQETLDCLKNTFWSKLHVFPFSVRKGTRAEQLDEKVRDYAIFERSRILRELSDARFRSFLQSQVGKKKDVLLERLSNRFPGVWRGHTENYIPTLTAISNGEAKKTIPAFIERCDGDKVWAAQA